MLYYKSTANNSALVMEILNLAKNQNFKKTLLAYFAALQVAQSKDGKLLEIKQILYFISLLNLNEKYLKENHLLSL